MAGLADSVRLTWRSRRRSGRQACSRACTKNQAPMFSGSSWSQTTSDASG